MFASTVWVATSRAKSETVWWLLCSCKSRGQRSSATVPVHQHLPCVFDLPAEGARVAVTQGEGCRGAWVAVLLPLAHQRFCCKSVTCVWDLHSWLQHGGEDSSSTDAFFISDSIVPGWLFLKRFKILIIAKRWNIFFLFAGIIFCSFQGQMFKDLSVLT